MELNFRRAVWLGVVLCSACSGGGGGGTDGGAGGVAGGSSAAGGTGGSAGASAGGVAGGVAGGSAGGAAGGAAGGSAGGAAGGASDGGVLGIRDALACGTPAPVSGIGLAGELQLYAVDPAVFPEALCNDGTQPIVYYRPYRGAANQHRWVIGLRGGGGCGNAAACAARWCSCNTRVRCPYASETTNFTLDNMSGGGRRGRQGEGVMLRDAGVQPDGGLRNPLEDYNQVQLIYCSSDAWRGVARDVRFDTTHPITGQPVSYTLHFLGQRVLEADLKVLRRDGVAGLSYTLGGANQAMPDLDDAVEVLLEGDSAGGAGVINNLDWVSAELKRTHAGCDGGAACPPEVVGLIDAVTGPELRRLDFSTSAGADAGVVTYDQYVAVTSRSPAVSGRGDESCAQWHMGDAGVCSDLTHVIRHHLTTPYFVRMALFDRLISSNYDEFGVRDPVLGPFDYTDAGVPRTFALVLRRELAEFPQQLTTAEERASMTVAPGVFAPACVTHDTIHTTSEVFGVTITTDAGVVTRLLDLYSAWRTGLSPAAVLTSSPTLADTFCP